MQRKFTFNFPDPKIESEYFFGFKLLLHAFSAKLLKDFFHAIGNGKWAVT